HPVADRHHRGAAGGVVVDDGGQCTVVADHRVGGTRQVEEEILLRFDGGVVDDGHPDGLDGLAGGEGEGAAIGGEVGAVERGAVAGAEVDRDQVGAGSVQPDDEFGEAVVLADRDVVDGDDGRGHRRLVAGADQGSAAGVGQGGADRGGQDEVEALLGLGGGIVGDRHGDQPDGVTGGEGEDARDGGEVGGGDGACGRGIVDGHGAGAGPVEGDGEGHRAGGLVHHPVADRHHRG